MNQCWFYINKRCPDNSSCALNLHCALGQQEHDKANRKARELKKNLPMSTSNTLADFAKKDMEMTQSKPPVLHSQLSKTIAANVKTGEISPAVGGALITATTGGVWPEVHPLDQPLHPDPAWLDGGGSIANQASPAMGPSGFKFGSMSLRNLNGVKEELVKCAVLALSWSAQDFSCTAGLRTAAEQAQLVKAGFSKTLVSKHLPQADGLSHAVDLVPYVAGRNSWDWPHVYNITAAMHYAATQLGIARNIRWGGAWDIRLSDMGTTAEDFAKAVQAYTVRHSGADFLDGPHYEWVD